MATEKEVKDALGFSADMCSEADNIYPYYHIRALAEEVERLRTEKAEKRIVELEHFLDGERIARQHAIDKGVELQRHNFLLMQSGKALRDALVFECKKLGDVPREIDEWDALVSSLPNAPVEARQ